MNGNLSFDHSPLSDTHATRRYFAKFERIIDHVIQVAEISQREGLWSELERDIVQAYLSALKNSFSALSHKHLMGDRVKNLSPAPLNIDKQDSGFPVYAELLRMATDALQAEKHLQNQPDAKQLKQEMVTHILNELSVPLRLQYALSQRLYYKELATRNLFWAQNDPQAIWLDRNDDGSNDFLIHWAVYDSQTNLPYVYLLNVSDHGRVALPRDERRWPRAQAHLIAQSISSLLPLTIAQGFDQDFDELYPTRLRRLVIGPMYSHAYTEQRGPLRDILAQAEGEPGLDWCLTWRVEDLRAKSTRSEKTGIFSSTERQVYDVDPQAMGQLGVTETRQAMILPYRAYQVLEELNPPSLRGIRKYVVGENNRLLSYR